ncbi:hypothetical protein ACFV0L_33805 [Streptosporangium canum]|uniref:hypothetical protein n=1 Tax=Streptosporangium canum TaxID=324952 RepID=UPI0036937895
MRSVIGLGVAAALVMGSGVPATASPPPPAGIGAVTGDHIPAELKNRTSLRVLPEWPRQNNNVRILAHCPPAANHAIIGSTAFTLKGSTRLYREVGLGLSNRGLGRRAVSISYYVLPGDHEVCMKCVKVTINQKTRIRKIRVISRYSVPLQVRRFRIAQFFD